jgi:hypothetical protein
LLSLSTATCRSTNGSNPAKHSYEYRSGQACEPDFVVETGERMLICEIKAQNELVIGAATLEDLIATFTRG